LSGSPPDEIDRLKTFAVTFKILECGGHGIPDTQEPNSLDDSQAIEFDEYKTVFRKKGRMS